MTTCNQIEQEIDSGGMAAPMFPGSALFALRDTRGFPLDFALDRIMNEQGLVVEWPGFIEAARSNGWWDFQVYEAVSNALIDAMVPRVDQKAILDRTKIYMTVNPHPRSNQGTLQ